MVFWGLKTTNVLRILALRLPGNSGTLTRSTNHVLGAMGTILEALKTMIVSRIVAWGASWRFSDAEKLDKS